MKIILFEEIPECRSSYYNKLYHRSYAKKRLLSFLNDSNRGLLKFRYDMYI